MQLDPEISELRRQIGLLAEGAARRIPERLGWRIGRAARAGMDVGWTRTTLAAELGISLQTLNRTLAVRDPSTDAERPGRTGFVQVAPVVEGAGLQIRLASGEVVEGLNLEQVIAFARGMR